MFFRSNPIVDFEYNGRTYSFRGFHHDDNIIRKIRKKRTFYELEILEFIKSQQLNGAYIDVGANIGNHTIYFAMECSATKIISFECYDRIFEILKENCSKNIEGAVRYQLNNLAVSERENAYIKPSNTDNIGMTKIVFENNDDELKRVRSMKLDDLEDELKKDIAFIKIDVEGNELDVIKSAEQILESNSPAVLVESMWDNFIEVNDFMLAKGYSLRMRFKTDPNLYYYCKKYEKR